MYRIFDCAGRVSILDCKKSIVSYAEQAIENGNTPVLLYHLPLEVPCCARVEHFPDITCKVVSELLHACVWGLLPTLHPVIARRTGDVVQRRCRLEDGRAKQPPAEIQHECVPGELRYGGHGRRRRGRLMRIPGEENVPLCSAEVGARPLCLRGC